MSGILPHWLASMWVLALVLIACVHCRHLLHARGQAAVWHCVHIAVALGMASMYAPVTILSVDTGFDCFGAAGVAVLAWALARVACGRALDGLWLVAAIDLAAMAYIWGAPGARAALAWALIAFFAAEALLWAGGTRRASDRRPRSGSRETRQRLAPADREPGGVAPLGTLLVITLPLRVSLATMTLAMAYMLVAMQLSG